MAALNIPCIFTRDWYSYFLLSSSPPPSTEIPIPSPLDSYESDLRSIYKKDPLPTYDKWPQIKGKKFINLSLLSKDEVSPQEAHKYTTAMFHGEISTISTERKMKMADIAQTKDGSCIMGRQRCVLIEGAPGSGKSTLAWKLCRKWGKGKILQQYRLVVLLRLREKWVREIHTVEGLFRGCKFQAIEEIVQNEGKGVLLLLDGWDELPTELREEESFFLDLPKGQMLKDAMVVVTSRPHASEIIVSECKDRIFQHIQVLGFSEDNVQAYMKSNTGDDEELLQGLQTYTSCYPHIRSMMYNPLSAAIVVEVYKNSWKEKTTIPKTMTELYSSLIRTLLLRYLKEHPIHGKRKWKRRLRQFTDLPLDVYQQLCKVSKIAHEGISNKQQVIFSDLPDDFDSLGLMQGVPELYVDEGTALSYNFLHLTIQEFLAAFHLSQQSNEQQIEMFRLHNNTSRYKMVLKFMAGLTKLEGFSEDAFLSLFQRHIESDLYMIPKRLPKDDYIEISLDGLHYLFEGRKWNILTTQSKVCFNQQRMSPFDSYILGYILSHTIYQWEVKYGIIDSMFAKGVREDEDQHPTEAGTISLYSKLGRYRKLLTHSKSFLSRIVKLHLLYGTFFAKSEAYHFIECNYLTQSLPSLPNLESLKLYNSIIGVVCSSSSQPHFFDPLSFKPYISQSLSPFPLSPDMFLESHRYPAFFNPQQSMPSLHHHIPDSPSIVSPPPPPSTSPGSRLIKVLQNHNTLKKLTLQNTRFGVVESAALAEWLSSPTCSLEELDISSNKKLTSEATKLIITALYHNCTVRSFNIAESRIPTQLLVRLLGLPLVSLDLSGCFIGRQGACKIARALCSNTVLEELDLSDNTIGDLRDVVFADTQQHYTLPNLQHNPIGDKGATALADMLLHNKSLKILHLKRTSLTAPVVCEIARALYSNTVLEELDLSDNPIGDIQNFPLYNAQQCCMLKKLQHNPIGDKGATALAAMLLHNKSLKILHLKGTSLTAQGICEIARALCSITVLEELDLSENKIGDEAATALAEMVQHNKSLKCLILSKFDFTAQSIEALREAEQHNSTLKIYFRPC